MSANPQPVPGETTTVQGGETLREKAEKLDRYMPTITRERGSIVMEFCGMDVQPTGPWLLRDDVLALFAAPEGGTLARAVELLRDLARERRSDAHVARRTHNDMQSAERLSQMAAEADSVAAALSRREDETSEGERAEHIDDWHEDDGPALWWRFPITEPPYVGTPLDSDWPGYHTHWTPIIVPRLRAVVGTGTPTPSERPDERQ